MIYFMFPYFVHGFFLFITLTLYVVQFIPSSLICFFFLFENRSSGGSMASPGIILRNNLRSMLSILFRATFSGPRPPLTFSSFP